jgi:DNA-directed RNA polymerase subunit RPC12/RpoP
MGIFMKHNEFQCFICKRIFEKTISDEEALKESVKIFGETNEPLEIVCEDCWKKSIQ